MPYEERPVVNERYPSEPARKLLRARRVLAGYNDEGIKVHPSMFDADVISFSHGEGMRRPHPSVIAAGIRALLDTRESSLENYLFLKRYRPLDEAITRSFTREGIDGETASHLCMDSGTTRLFCGFLYAVVRPGDVVLAAPTFYHPLASWCDIAGVRLVCVPTRRENDYKLTVADIDYWLSSQTYDKELRLRALCLFNPTMSGAVYTNTELIELAEFICENNLVAIEDTIFRHTEYDPEIVPRHLASYPGMSDRVVTVDGGSKAYSLANVRIGWGCGPQRIIDEMNYYTLATLATVPHLSKAMALAALQAPDSYLRGNAVECRERAQLIMHLIARSNKLVVDAVGVAPETPFMEVEHAPKAGHSILVSFNGLQGMALPDGSILRDSIDLTRYLLTEAKVSVSPGLSCGFDDCKVRLSFGCVGLEHTYQETCVFEMMAALEEVAKHFNSVLPLRELDALLNCFDKKQEDYPERLTSGFAAGRRQITEALLERMVPAIAKLTVQNRHFIKNLNLSR